MARSETHPTRPSARFIAAFGILLVLASIAAAAQQPDSTVLNTLRAEIIPAVGTETPYGRPLTLQSLPWFIHWWYTLVPTAMGDPRFEEALLPLVAPCCDDNTAFSCCCESDGKACNVIRSGKGLAAHLILDHDYSAEEIQASVSEWLHFARPDYYLAAALQERDLDPESYDLTTAGSCYRMMCNTPMSQGGCGGMNALNEPALAQSGT